MHLLYISDHGQRWHCRGTMVTRVRGQLITKEDHQLRHVLYSVQWSRFISEYYMNTFTHTHKRLYIQLYIY